MIPTAVKIKLYKLGEGAKRQFNIKLPQIWMDEHRLKPGDSVDLLKDIEGRLIIIPGDRQEQESGP
jgi:phosphate uptake regulator